MKKIITYGLGFFLSTQLLAQNPVPNPSFELWTGTEPDDWLTTNTPTDFTVTQVMPGNSGTYAMRGEVISTGPSSQLAPIVVSIGGGTGFPVTQVYPDMTFWFKSGFLNNDYLQTDILFSDSAGNVTAVGTLNFATSNGVFTKGVLPVTNTGGTPATCTIVFSIVNAAGAPSVGSYFIIDDVSMGSSVGINDQLTADNSMIISPNPVTDQLHLTISNKNRINEIKIMDMQGRIVIQSKDQSFRQVIDVSGLSKGLYFIEATGDAVLTRKIFVKQ